MSAGQLGKVPANESPKPAAQAAEPEPTPLACEVAAEGVKFGKYRLGPFDPAQPSEDPCIG